MSISTKRSSHAATRTSTKRIYLPFYLANLQICEAGSAGEPIDRLESQSPIDNRQRTAENIYAAYVCNQNRSCVCVIMCRVQPESGTEGQELEIKVVNFDRAGKLGSANYPVVMNAAIDWPGAPRGFIDENHDEILLRRTLPN